MDQRAEIPENAVTRKERAQKSRRRLDISPDRMTLGLQTALLHKRQAMWGGMSSRVRASPPAEDFEGPTRAIRVRARSPGLTGWIRTICGGGPELPPLEGAPDGSAPTWNDADHYLHGTGHKRSSNSNSRSAIAFTERS